jgi:predicted nucleotidyltransferase
MSVVDEKSRVPELDAAALERLRDALDQQGVDVAYLIGSQARGTAGPLSDLDLAIIHSPDLDSRSRLDLRLRLMADAGAALDTTEVDIVLLNGAPPLIRHRALSEGVLLVENDPAARVGFYVRTLNDYVDTEPLRKLISDRLHASIEEDRFGRPA